MGGDADSSCFLVLAIMHLCQNIVNINSGFKHPGFFPFLFIMLIPCLWFGMAKHPSSICQSICPSSFTSVCLSVCMFC